MTHTKAPWATTEYPLIIYDKEGQAIANCVIRPNISKATARANANLIAAAPEMLEALELMFHNGKVTYTYEAQEKALAAIKKAKGARG